MFGLRRRPLVVEPARRRAGAIAATLSLGRTRRDVTIEVPGWEPPPRDDPFVPIAFLLGMAARRDVVVEGPVGGSLLGSLDAVRRDLGAWYPALPAPAFRADAVVPEGPATAPRHRMASFFSGGLDSFYTALVHADDITHLLFVHGFDVRLDDAALRDQVGRRTREAATQLGQPLIEASTDLRSLSDRHANWSWYSHAGLIAVALFLAGHFEEVVVPATLAVAHRPEALRHPVDGESWSGGACRIRTDGAEATRPQKARIVAGHAAARAHLRVCWENRDGAYNCGRCTKCVRTLLDLEVAGVRERFASFPTGWDVASVRHLPTATRSDRQFLEECLWMAEAEGRCPDLVALLRERLAGAA